MSPAVSRLRASTHRGIGHGRRRGGWAEGESKSPTVYVRDTDDAHEDENVRHDEQHGECRRAGQREPEGRESCDHRNQQRGNRCGNKRTEEREALGRHSDPPVKEVRLRDVPDDRVEQDAHRGSDESVPRCQNHSDSDDKDGCD